MKIKLEELKRQRRTTWADLADKTGYCEGALRAYAKGRRTMNAVAIKRLCEALQCSVNELIDFELRHPLRIITEKKALILTQKIAVNFLNLRAMLADQFMNNHKKHLVKINKKLAPLGYKIDS